MGLKKKIPKTAVNKPLSADDIITGRLRQSIPPGTVRKGSPSEEMLAKTWWRTVGSHRELKEVLRKDPETPLYGELSGGWEHILRTVRESGASGMCRILIAERRE